MTESKPESTPTLPRRQLGRYLVDWRTRAGFTQVDAARRLEMGATSLNRLEKGQNSRIKGRDIRAICDLYGVPDDLTEALIGLAQQANVKSWWHQYGDLIPKDFDVYVGLESSAIKIATYQPDLIPGLLQTRQYSAALSRRVWPDADQADLDRRIELKIQRQNLITRRTQPLSFDAVIGEPALHRLNGDRTLMVQQLRHLADMSTRDNIEIRLLPYEAGFPDGMAMASFVVLNFGADSVGNSLEPPLIFLEGAVGSMYLEAEDDVAFYTKSYDNIRRAALDAEASRTAIRKIAREHEQRER